MIYQLIKKGGVLISVALLSFQSSTKKISLWMIGDSTMSVKEVKAYPETGWGMPFAYFFDSSVTIQNRAKNGRSTKTFISENLWQPVANNMREGDYILIQFGHNDESKEKTDRYTTPEEYKANITRFITEALNRKVHPVLLTPVSRRKFKEGKQVATHEIYSTLVRSVAAEANVPLIDLDAKSMELYNRLGEEASKLLFLQIEPGVHPNYPDGKIDNTHFSELGARLIAQIVLAEIKAQKLELANHVIVRRGK